MGATGAPVQPCAIPHSLHYHLAFRLKKIDRVISEVAFQVVRSISYDPRQIVAGIHLA